MASPWFKDPDPNARVRLLCLPYAGGGTVEYRQWGLTDRVRDAGLDVLPIVLPGRDRRLAEPPFRAMGPLVDVLTGALRPALDRPYALFGHSMGAWIGFALARKLRTLGLPAPVRIFASGRRAPHLPDRFPPIHAAPEPEFLSALQERYQALPAEVLGRPEVLAVFLPTLRADFCLFETWRYTEEAPLQTPVSAWVGEADLTLGPGDLEAWARHTTGDFRTRRFAGGHFYLRQAKDEVLDGILGELG